MPFRLLNAPERVWKIAHGVVPRKTPLVANMNFYKHPYEWLYEQRVVLVELEIPAGAQVHEPDGHAQSVGPDQEKRKCRASKAKVISVKLIQFLNFHDARATRFVPMGKVAVSGHTLDTCYIPGEVVEPHDFGLKPEICAPGIHFFHKAADAIAFRRDLVLRQAAEIVGEHRALLGAASLRDAERAKAAAVAKARRELRTERDKLRAKIKQLSAQVKTAEKRSREANARAREADLTRDALSVERERAAAKLRHKKWTF